MTQSAQNSLSPWIQDLIQSYGSKDGSSSNGRLKAHVLGVGHMSQSQAQVCEGPTGPIFLSDGAVQIPAFLTASAWEHLQEQEDRECLTSLLNTTVSIHDYQLQFHMAQEQIKCRFFLLVEGLVTSAAGPIQEYTPCCTALPSVKQKTSETWKALQGQEEWESQKNQFGFNLSELLAEWQHGSLQDIMEEVRERLMAARSQLVSQQPSTSICDPAPVHPDTLTTTSWDVDRVNDKGIKHFSVPVKCLLIPEEVSSGRLTLPIITKHSEDTQHSVEDADWRMSKPAVKESEHHTNENPPLPEEDSMLHEDTVIGIIDSDIRPLANPWDIFPPPCVTPSSSDASPEATMIHSPHSPTTTEHPVIITSTQLSIHSSKESKGEQSFFPPYQEPPPSTSLTASTASDSVSPPEPYTRSSDLAPAADECRTHTAQPDSSTLDQESQILDMQEETVERKYRKAKRKRSEPRAEAVSTLVEDKKEEAPISGSPPSWLFETQTGPTAKKGTSHLQGQTIVMSSRKTPTCHSDSTRFSYSYKVSGQNLTDLSRFAVSGPLLQWAVKYLIPNQNDNPQNTSEMSGHKSSTL